MQRPTMIGSDKYAPKNSQNEQHIMQPKMLYTADPNEPTAQPTYLSIQVYFDKFTVFKGSNGYCLIKFDLSTVLDPSKHGIPPTGLAGYQMAPFVAQDDKGVNISVSPAGLMYADPSGQLIKFTQKVRVMPTSKSDFDPTEGGTLYPGASTSLFLIPVSPGTTSPVVTVE